MVEEKKDWINNNAGLPPIQQNRPALSWESKVKKKVRAPSCLGMFRPVMGQCCHQCTPDSLGKNLGQNSFLGFRNLLSINETQTRYRGWLVRRVCCILFVSGCKVYGSPVSDRLKRVGQSNRVREVLGATHKAPEGEDSQGQLSLLSPFLPSLAPAFPLASYGLSLVYVYVRQSALDCALIPLVLFCHSLRVPYTVCPLHIKSSFLRSILQKVGVVLLPPFAATELEAEMHPLYSAVRTSLVRELLHEGQALSVGVSAESGHGGQWLALIRQLIKEGSIPDVSLVPVGISYDCVTTTDVKVGLHSVLQWLLSLLWKKPVGSVMIHIAQPFSLKEMCESGRCRVDEWLPLQDLLLPVVLNNRTDCVFGKRRMSWLLPTFHSAPELEGESRSDRDLNVAIVLHLIFSAASCTAVMSTSLVSSLLLYKHSKGVSTSVLCRDVAWLLEELFFRNRDVGFGGTLPEIVHYSLRLLAPHLVIAAMPSGKDPIVAPRPSFSSILHLSLQAQKRGAVSAMLCEVVFSGASSRVRTDSAKGEEVRGDMEFDVVLGQSELTEKALQLCHLLPPGMMPPCQSAQSFALDAVDSLVRCGILVMEEISRDVPICDFWKKEGTLTWTTSDDPYHSDSDCEEPELCSYKNVSWTFEDVVLDHHGTGRHGLSLAEAEFLSQIHSHLRDTANQKKRHYESCSEEAAHTAVRALIELGVVSGAQTVLLPNIFPLLKAEIRRVYVGHTQVLLQKRETGGIFLGVSPLFQLSENRQKLQRFISQYLYN